MKAWKIVIVSILGLIDSYLLYSFVGYLVLGIRTPKIIGEPATTFMGMYIMSITFFVLFAVISAVLIILCIKFFKKKK